MEPDINDIYQLANAGPAAPHNLQRHLGRGRGVQLGRGMYFLGSGKPLLHDLGQQPANAGGAGYQILTPAGTTAASLGAVCGCTVEGQTLADGSFLLDRTQFVGQLAPPRGHENQEACLSVGGRRNLDGMVEVFNVFNHKNYGSYTTTFSSGANYGKPSFNPATAFQPRVLQLGVHFSF